MRDRIERLEESARPLDPDAEGRRRLHDAVSVIGEAYLREADLGKAFVETNDGGAGLIDDRFTLRMAALSFRTHLRHIDLALELLQEHVRAVGSLGNVP
jgi:hypothetical protein